MPTLHRIRLIYWRVFRPVILGSFAIVWRQANGSREVLLVRHTYQDGWFLPGGGIKKGETFHEGVRRELREECGIDAAEIRLLGVYLNGASGAIDHVATFVVENFSGEARAADPHEVAEARFYDVATLPADLKRGHRNRIMEWLGQRDVGDRW